MTRKDGAQMRIKMGIRIENLNRTDETVETVEVDHSMISPSIELNMKKTSFKTNKIDVKTETSIKTGSHTVTSNLIETISDQVHLNTSNTSDAGTVTKLDTMHVPASMITRTSIKLIPTLLITNNNAKASFAQFILNF